MIIRLLFQNCKGQMNANNQLLEKNSMSENWLEGAIGEDVLHIVKSLPSRAFPTPNSPQPMDIYGNDPVGYVQATSPQPSGFPQLCSRVSVLCALLKTL